MPDTTTDIRKRLDYLTFHKLSFLPYLFTKPKIENALPKKLRSTRPLIFSALLNVCRRPIHDQITRYKCRTYIDIRVTEISLNSFNLQCYNNFLRICFERRD